jgi:hypothetical protein
MYIIKAAIVFPFVQRRDRVAVLIWRSKPTSLRKRAWLSRHKRAWLRWHSFAL